METIIACTIFGVFILMSFVLGLVFGCKLKNNEKIAIPNLNIIKTINKSKQEKDYQKKRELEEEITKLEKERKEVRQKLTSVTKSNTDIVMSLYNNAAKYIMELGVENSDLVARSYLFASNYKELSGAILHKTAYAFRLAYILEVERKLGIKLPILLDSPRGNEVDEVNTNRMMDILKRDFDSNQIIIASIYEYDFASPNVIELHGKLLDV